MQTRNKQRINVTIHRIDKWLDHPNGTATTLCGLVVQADISQQIIDMSEVVSEVSCPLCEMRRAAGRRATTRVRTTRAFLKGGIMPDESKPEAPPPEGDRPDRDRNAERYGIEL